MDTLTAHEHVALLTAKNDAELLAVLLSHTDNYGRRKDDEKVDPEMAGD